jgi:hypothetical protein
MSVTVGSAAKSRLYGHLETDLLWAKSGTADRQGPAISNQLLTAVVRYPAIERAQRFAGPALRGSAPSHPRRSPVTARTVPAIQQRQAAASGSRAVALSFNDLPPAQNVSHRLLNSLVQRRRHARH